MKTLISTLALSLSLCVLPSVHAQTKSSVQAPAADTVMLSQSRDGDYVVSRYLVKHNSGMSADFMVYYPMNVSKMTPAFSGNAAQLSSLKTFMGTLATDSMMHVKSVTVTGYSSPDGVEAANQTLASARAADFKSYLDMTYSLSKKYPVTVNVEVNDWDACIPALNASSLPDRQKAVAVINSNLSMSAKEVKLKAMNDVWNYLTTKVLPTLRRADVVFDYGRDQIIEKKVMVAKPAPKQAAQPKPANNCPCGCEVMTESVLIIDGGSNGMIIDMNAVGVDY